MNKLKNNNLLIGSLCAIGCEFFYGLSYIFTKQATASASEFALLGWRFLIAILVMSFCVLAGLIKVNLKGKALKPLLLIALFSPTIYFTGETLGISQTTASESGAFLACIPVASLLASALILKKKPTKLQTAGILITLMGVLITIFAVGTSSSLSIPGYSFLLLAVLAYALYSVFVEKAFDYSGAEITYIMLTAGAIIFVSLALLEASLKGTTADLLTLPLTNKHFLQAILYQGIGCSIIAFFLANVAIAKIGVNRTSSYIGVATVVSILAGSVLLGESFSLAQILGVLLIVAGVYTANAKNSSE